MPATQTQPTVRISKDQIDFFHENGYLAVDAITTPEEVESLQRIYDRIFEQRAGREEGSQFDLGGADQDGERAVLPQILDPLRFAPELQDTLARVNARAISEQLLGPKSRDRGSHAILKPAGYGAPTPWHQDEAYWNQELQYRSLSVWIPFQEATVENGCLWFVPGSHRLAVLPHHRINNDARVHGLELDDPEKHTKGAVACPLPPGGATFHFNNTLHYAGPNTSASPRRALILGFGLPDRKRKQPRRFPWQEVNETPRMKRREKWDANQKAAETGATPKTLAKA